MRLVTRRGSSLNYIPWQSAAAPNLSAIDFVVSSDDFSQVIMNSGLNDVTNPSDTGRLRYSVKQWKAAMLFFLSLSASDHLKKKSSFNLSLTEYTTFNQILAV